MLVAAQAARNPSDKLVSANANDTIQTGRLRVNASPAAFAARRYRLR
jgi:hypothetical protein